MKTYRNFSFVAPRWPIIFTWFYLVSSFSLATQILPCPVECECSRNRDRLQKATCTDVQWDKIVYPNIQILELKSTNIDIRCYIPKDISLLFPQLNFISLKNCSLTQIPNNSFRGLKLLQEVDLSHNSIRKFSHLLFTANTKLRYVNLENNPLSVSIQHPLLTSSSMWEMNLASCNLSDLPRSMFKGLPNLRYISLANNKLDMIRQNTLPNGLRKLDLSQNMIVNVPVFELDRLKKLKEIDISHNPINCTCKLIDFQDRTFSKAIVFRNPIRCVLPTQYVGYLLQALPRSQLCEVKEQHEWLISNLIQLNNSYIADEEFSEADNDDFLFNVNIDQVVSKEEKHHRNRRSSNHTKSNEKTEIIVEGSGNEEVDTDSSGDEEISNLKYENETEKNKSVLVQTFSKTLVNTNKSESLDNSSLKEEYKDLLSQSTASPEAGNSQAPLIYATDTSETITWEPMLLNNVTTTARKESEVTESSRGSYFDEKTTAITPVLPNNSISASDMTSEEDRMNNNSTQSISIAPTVDIPIKKTEDATAKESHNNEPTDYPTTSKIEVEKTVMTEPSNASHASQIKSISAEKKTETHFIDSLGLPHSEYTSNGYSGSTAPTTINESKKSAIDQVSEKTEDSITQSSAGPIQDQITENKNVKSATSTPYIISLLSIMAVTFVCLATYCSSQHKCRPKSWNHNDPKVNTSTELQDVSLLGPDIQHQKLDLYSKKYESEGKNAQTEKLMNNGGSSYSDENNCALPISESLISDNVPQVQKSTIRVTTNYESLPKKPAIIHKTKLT